MATTSIPNNRSYAVRRQMQAATGRPEGNDVSGSWAAVVVHLTAGLERLGYELGDYVVLEHTSNAGFRGIEVSGRDAEDDDPRPFHGVDLGAFELV